MKPYLETEGPASSKCARSCWTRALIASGSLLCASIISAGGQQLQATFSNPTASGASSITIQAEVPGVYPNTIGTGGVSISPVIPVYQDGKIISEAVRITIPIAKNTTDIGKANAVAVGLQQAFGPSVGRDPNNLNNPTVILPAGSTFSVTKDTTGEKSVTVAVVGGVAANFNTFQFAWVGDPTGVDAMGDPSVFNASFGYDGFTDSVSFTADQLPSLTLDSLTEQMFTELDANLPPLLEPDLTIDLPDDQITFQIPDGSIDPFFSNSSTDVSTIALGGINDVQTAEPPSVILVALGTIALLGCSALKRKTERALFVGARSLQ